MDFMKETEGIYLSKTMRIGMAGRNMEITVAKTAGLLWREAGSREGI